MDKEKLYSQIRRTVEKLPCWRDIRAGHTEARCKDYSTEIYQAFNEPGHHIDGLALGVVTSLVDRHCDHAWLVAFHPDAGYFIMDPTLGQFTSNMGKHKPFNDMFIGTYTELEKRMLSPEYGLQKDQFYQIWSPALYFHQYAKRYDAPMTGFYKPEEVESIWKRNPFKIAEKRPDSDLECHGMWAARMEEAGLDWKKHLREDCKKHAQFDHAATERFIIKVEHARNKHIELGVDKGGMPYTDRIKGYQPPEKGGR